MLSEVQVQAKEAYMAPLDSWIGERRGVVYSYAVALSRLPETRRLQGKEASAVCCVLCVVCCGVLC